jgi:hypothetical protein
MRPMTSFSMSQRSGRPRLSKDGRPTTPPHIIHTCPPLRFHPLPPTGHHHDSCTLIAIFRRHCIALRCVEFLGLYSGRIVQSRASRACHLYPVAWLGLAWLAWDQSITCVSFPFLSFPFISFSSVPCTLDWTLM